jgi:hypothetical protein
MIPTAFRISFAKEQIQWDMGQFADKMLSNSRKPSNTTVGGVSALRHYLLIEKKKF